MRLREQARILSVAGMSLKEFDDHDRDGRRINMARAVEPWKATVTGLSLCSISMGGKERYLAARHRPSHFVGDGSAAKAAEIIAKASEV